MTRKVKLARIGLKSAVKIGFFLSAAAGLLIGLFWGMIFALFSSLVAMAVHARHSGMGPGALIFLPLFSALFCGFFGAGVSFLVALVYNIVAGTFGGLEIEADFRDGAERAAELPPPAPEDTGGDATRDGVRGFHRTSFRGPAERSRTLGLRRAKRRMGFTSKAGTASSGDRPI